MPHPNAWSLASMEGTDCLEKPWICDQNSDHLTSEPNSVVVSTLKSHSKDPCANP